MCGVFGIYGHQEAAKITYLGLHALQHRGQESSGIVASDGARLAVQRRMGRVQDGFKEADFSTLEGQAAIGHVRYSTAGGSQLKNAQPLAVDYAGGSLAVAHNGNLTNHEALREQLEQLGSIYQSGSDTESMLHLIARSASPKPEDRIAEALAKVEGAYSVLLLTPDRLIAVRDPMGVRPLSLGRMLRDGDTIWVVSSEPSSFELIGAEYVRDVEPGEMVLIDDAGIRSQHPFTSQPPRACLFEWVYFARPDSHIDGASVYEVRKELGGRLADEHPLPPTTAPRDAVVIPVPDSGVPAAIGFAKRSGLHFEMGLIRSHYIGRTFIEPEDSIRHFGVRLKLAPNRATIEGRRVVVVDDSLVRGTTSRKIVRMLRDAGAHEVHVRISCPPTKHSCFYGIDTPTRDELIAAQQSVEEIRAFLGADSLGYLSLEGLCQAVRDTKTQASSSRRAQSPHDDGDSEAATAGYCHACFSGDYPIPISTTRTGRKLRLVGG